MNLKLHGDRNPKALISDPQGKGVENQNQNQSKNQNPNPNQHQNQNHNGQNHHSNNPRNNQQGNWNTFQSRWPYCNMCKCPHPGQCYPVCSNCNRRHNPNAECRFPNQPNWNQNWHQQPPNNGGQGTGYIPVPSSNSPSSSNTSANTSSSTATESVFHFNGINAQCDQSTDSETEGLTRNSWIYDSGSSWYICNDWNKMENVV